MMIAQDFKEVKIIWKSTNITKATGYGMSYRATILLAVSETTGGRTGAYRYMGAAALELSARKQAGSSLQLAAQWQIE